MCEAIIDAVALESFIPGITETTLDIIDNLLLKKREMLMKEVTFENARLGDKVWDFEFGWGTVEEWSKNSHLIVKLDTNGQYKSYTLDGKRQPGYGDPPTNQVLFWGPAKVLLTVPKRPIRKVKKTFWINIYTTNTAGEPASPYIGFHGVHNSEQEAKDAADTNNRSIQYPLEIEVNE
jgi:hypothetical protein